MLGTPQGRIGDLLALENDRTLNGPELRQLLSDLATMAFAYPTRADDAGAVADIFWPRGRRRNLPPVARGS